MSRGGADPGSEAPEREWARPVVEPRPLLLSVKEAAALLGIGRSTLYRLIERGEIPSVHIGGSRRIPLSAAHEFVEALLERSAGDAEGSRS